MPSYIDQVTSLGPRIWYRFNETAGSPVNSGSLSNTLTAFGTPLQNEQTDVDGRAIYLNGTSNYRLSPFPSFTIFDDRSFSIEMWVKASSTDVSQIFQPQLFTANHATASNRYVVLEFIGSAAAADTGKISFFAVNGSGTGNEVRTTQTFNDNQWHHIVATLNTTSMKLYVDGTLKASKTVNYGSTFDLDAAPLGKKILGNDYRGRIDEFALYDYELSAAQILANYNAGASVDFAPGVLGTASALAVQPTQTTTAQLTAAPMTASADGSGHAASTIDLPKLLNTYMGELTLETWFKFDINRYLQNYGSGTTAGANWTGTPKNDVAGGIQGTGSIALNNTDLVLQIGTQMSSLLQDEDFAIGFWVKKLTKEATTAFFTSLLSTGTDLVEFSWNADGGIRFRINANNQNHDISSSTDITDGEWHFVVGKFSSNTQQLWIDNTSIGTNTINQGLTLDITRFQGGGSTDDISLSQFFIATSANIGTTQIANIYDYGIPTSTQAAAYMPPAAPKFNSAFNDYIQSKSPLFDFRMDEGSGVPRNFGSAEITLSSELSPQGYVQNESGLNTRTFKFTDRAQGLRGNYNLSSGTLSSNNTATIGVLFKTNWKTLGHTHVGLGGTVSGSNGIYLNTINTGVLRVFSGNANGTTTNLTGTTDFTDNKWHLAIVVQEANTLKLYVDGKLEASTTRSTAFTDAGQFSIALPPGLSQTANNTLVKYIDEAFATNTAFTAQEVFEAWQALRLEMDTTATAEFVMPTNIAGTGTTQTAAVTTASALFPISTNITEQILDAAPGTASALFVFPNFGGNVVIDANYGHTAATASAVFHDPQFQIGDFHTADHMNASADMVHPVSIAGGAISVNPGVAGPATFVMPGIVTVKGARAFAEPMLSSALFPLPPAYTQLADDPWYVRLYAGHFDGLLEVGATLGGPTNLPNQQIGSPIKGGFLTFFDDVSSDVTTTSTPNTIENELGQFAYTVPDQLEYDDEGTLIPLDTTGILVRATTSRQSTTPQPIVSTGFYDPYERKAVRITNIEFPFPGTLQSASAGFYNIEFSIKTTKSDQILTHGFRTISQANSVGRIIGVVGLSDGKLYLTEDNYVPYEGGLRGSFGSLTAPHPKNGITKYMIGRTNIADNKWHHVIVQYGLDGRAQIWVDGALDRQIITAGPFPGINKINTIRPYILGYNGDDPLLNSDFQTSAWNFYPGRFLDSRSISLNNTAYVKSKPIKVQPFTATLTMTQNNNASGNRGRALMLFFWPKTGALGNVLGSVGQGTIDYGKYTDINNIDESTFATELLTIDYKGFPPQEYYGWDIFPMDVTGQYGTGIQTFGPRVNSEMLSPEVWTSEDGYRDTVTGARRYLDLTKDIDLSKFDAIFFKNFPEQTEELDEYARTELVDQYFGLEEKELYNDFIKSLRAAVDSGISLYVTNAKLALDLGIIDRYEIVSDMREGTFSSGSAFVRNKFSQYFGSNGTSSSPESTNWNGLYGGIWHDTLKNNKFRIVNTLDNLTNESSYIWKDWMFVDSPPDSFGDAARPYISLLNKPNGLQIGDEFIMSDSTIEPYRMEAVPFNNVKAGKIIAAFANTVNQNGVETENPYRNHATVIALESGITLDGKPLGGKIFVNFTERLDSHYRAGSRDTFAVDLIQDEWINLAYNTGLITLADKNGYLASPNNLDRQLENAIAANNQTLVNIINELKYWDSNGDYILTQRKLFSDFTGSGAEKDGLGDGSRTARVNKVNKSGALSTQSVTSTSLFFKLEYGWEYPRIFVTVPSMLTRGFRWLSGRIVDEGKVVRVEPMISSVSEMPMPSVAGDKDRTVYAQSMLANGNITNAVGFTPTTAAIAPLPMFADVKFGDFVKNIVANVFTATANMRQDVRTVGIQEDEIVVYIMHVDPILYIREEVIK
jgi:hypothetical protein